MRIQKTASLCLFLVLVVLISIGVARAESISGGQHETIQCPGDTRSLLEQARLSTGTNDDLAKTVLCLAEAVDRLDSQMKSLVKGEVVFEGPVTAPSFLHGTKDRGNVE